LSLVARLGIFLKHAAELQQRERWKVVMTTQRVGLHLIEIENP